MTTYSVFGIRFCSALSFEDLQVVPGPEGDRVLHVVSGPAPDRADLALLGTDDVTTGVQVRLFRHEAGLRLVFDDTGVFDVVDGGRSLRWYRPPAAEVAAARLDVLGRVLPLSLHLEGTYTLHGSAVRLGQGAVAFLAPKHHGKSTLARALAEAGAELLSDDAVPVYPGSPPRTVPGIRRVRLWSDAAARFGAGAAEDVPQRGDKLLLAPPAASTLTEGALPLSAIYLLEPVPPRDDVPAVERAPVAAVEATVALVAHMKLGALLGASEAVPVLRFCAALPGCVPVNRLRVVRDFDRLGEVVAQLQAWHAAEVVVGA